ncbi:class I SAM-dependent methyltransferase [Phycicoccus flavus]|uniref:class I SAM-dependent methyltransferase n=1 Tax=Phycicoccus flavus TaxID=2502783 RepID=UPI000FEC0CCA|nr:class I SAM-dependent methyltransferase [Phycicoccus flavus]NHA67768.1 class I SAM-dependent methyltransferase [Phycicoccus flavus]
MPEERARRQDEVDARVRAYYGSEFAEADRLTDRSGQGLLELHRTQSLVTARVPAGSAVIDVGGGPGAHAALLARRGDRVVLVDPVPEHVARAAEHGTFLARVGDARELPDGDDSYDAALLLGPLYHLLERADRLQALREAARVVRPGGWVFAAAVSRLTTVAWVTALQPALLRAAGRPVPERDPLPPSWDRLVAEGRGGLSATGFPGGHFHLADELEEEVGAAGLVEVEVVGLEGPAALALDVTGRSDPALVAAADLLADAFAGHAGTRDLSPHLLALARVPG